LLKGSVVKKLLRSVPMPIYEGIFFLLIIPAAALTNTVLATVM
jgi:hypothetical protein